MILVLFWLWTMEASRLSEMFPETCVCYPEVHLSKVQVPILFCILNSSCGALCVCVCVCVCVCDRQGLGLHPHRTGWWGTLWLFAHKSKLKVLLWLESATWSASITAPTSCYLGILMLSRLVSLIFSSIYRLILASVSLHCCFLCLNALSPNLYGWLP